MKHLLLALTLLLPTTLPADTIQLNWVLPIERTDNYPLLPEEIANIEVYNNQIEVTNFESYPMPGGSVAVIFEISKPGLHVLTLRTRDTDNRVSVDSESINYQVLANPKPPTSLTLVRLD